jgi:GNAT superfamily N-acetyltransferase
MEIRPATPEVWPLITELFAHGDPRWCWCQFWRSTGVTWTGATADENRASLEAQARGDPAPGLVAIRDGVAVGWVGLGPRGAFGRLTRSRTIPQLPGDGVWVVICFVVTRTARRSGVARALLEAAVGYARTHGARSVEGYPVDTAGVRIPSASMYTGARSMFEAAGFSLASPTTSKASAGSPRVVMRLDLDGAG